MLAASSRSLGSTNSATFCARPRTRWPSARAELEATRPGGLGKRFDWRLLEKLQTRVPFMLSGGLDALNVVEALRITAAPGVDVSSGVERAPGEKDPDKIRAFIAAARDGGRMRAAPDRAMSRA